MYRLWNVVYLQLQYSPSSNVVLTRMCCVFHSSNILSFLHRSFASVVLHEITEKIFNYNYVEQLFLFSSCIICVWKIKLRQSQIIQMRGRGERMRNGTDRQSKSNTRPSINIIVNLLKFLTIDIIAYTLMFKFEICEKKPASEDGYIHCSSYRKKIHRSRASRRQQKNHRLRCVLGKMKLSSTKCEE